jgi:hypothetical protein
LSSLDNQSKQLGAVAKRIVTDAYIGILKQEAYRRLCIVQVDIYALQKVECYLVEVCDRPETRVAFI